MAKFFALFLVLLAISYAYGLSCYDCKGPKDEVCQNVVACGKSADPNQQAACLKRITKDNGVMNYKRSCTFVSSPKFDKSSECRTEDVECLSCQEDKCNSASGLNKFPIVALLALIVPLIFMY